MARAAKKTKMPSARKSISAEERNIGTEVTNWMSIPEDQYENAVYQTLRHYGYFYDIKEGNKWAAEWVKKNRSSLELKQFRAAEPWRTSMTICGLCKMHMNGAQLSEKRIQWISDTVNKTIEIGKEKIKEKEALDKANVNMVKKTPADIVKEKTSDFIGAIEEVIDMFNSKTWCDYENYSVYNELKIANLPTNAAKAIIDYYTPLKEEIEELLSLPTPAKRDDMQTQLAEGYSHLTKKQQKQFLALINQIIEDAEKYQGAKKASRKPRIAKPKTASQQTSKMKYMKESSDYKVVSLEPANLVGATEAYLFNVKTRRVTYLVAYNQKGFEINGSTIKQFDPEQSGTKTLRKPEQFITDMTKVTKAKAKKVFDALKTKPASANGRVNDQTIILKVY
jgi:hypothetical protein